MKKIRCKSKSRHTHSEWNWTSVNTSGCWSHMYIYSSQNSKK